MKHPDTDTHPPQQDQVKASKVIEYVLTQRDCFPWEDGVMDQDIYEDLPNCVFFEPWKWVSVSKAGFARWKQVAPSQVSRWIAAGLPVRSDDRINLWEGLNWLSCYEAQNHRRRRRDGRESIL
jgi:hypothetical protein